MMAHSSCCPVIVPPPCPVCGSQMVRVYDEYYGCSKDGAEKTAILKQNPNAKVEPVHSFAILDWDGKFYFEGDFFFCLNQMIACSDEDDWLPRAVRHVVI